MYEVRSFLLFYPKYGYDMYLPSISVGRSNCNHNRKSCQLTQETSIDANSLWHSFVDNDGSNNSKREKQHEKVEWNWILQARNGRYPKPRLFNNNTHYKIEIFTWCLVRKKGEEKTFPWWIANSSRLFSSRYIEHPVICAIGTTFNLL